MKSINSLIIFLIVAIFVLNSCKDEDDTRPVVTNLEIGHDDTIYVGGEVHLEFEVEDDGKLDYYTVKYILQGKIIKAHSNKVGGNLTAPL